MPSKKKDELVSRIKQVGWDLMESEGAYYIAEQGDWISKEFEPILNQPWKDYFALETVEIKESFLSEEGDRMAISWESLCDRIIHWDGFMAKYPEFPLIGSIQSLGSIRYNHAEYVEALLIGKDLTIVGDKEDGQLLPEVKKEYERFIKVNTKSKFHPLFKEYYDLLSKNNFMLDEKALGFLTQERVRSLFEEDKPPTR
jgi:hypothetical protein